MKIFESYSRRPMWIMALLLTALVAGCSDDNGRDPILGGGIIEGLPQPVVIAVAPVNDAQDVSISTMVTAQFSESINPVTGDASFVLSCESPCVDPVGTVTLDVTNTIATFTVDAPSTLEPLTTYTATVTGVTSLDTGRAMANPYTWQFMTDISPETVRPRITGTVPATTVPGPTTGINTNAAITAVFTESMAPETLSTTSFTLTCAAPCVAPSGNVSYSVGSKKAVYLPDAPLEENVTYTATITTAATDLANNELAGDITLLPAASDYVWTFTTVVPVPPALEVLSVVPLAGASGVSISTIATAEFSEPVDPLTGGASFVLSCEAPCTNPVGTVTLDVTNTVATFTVDAPATLEPLTTYTATITGATSIATDVVLASPYVWQFMTGITPDNTRPRVSATVPLTVVPGPALDVPINTAIKAVFTENMDAETITDISFTVTCVLPCVSPAGGVSYASGSKTALFLPENPLEEGATYTATVTTVATDVAGNALAGDITLLPLASNYVWTFTTVTAVLQQPVTVDSNTRPLNGAVEVCPTNNLRATFIVPSGLGMNPLDVNALTFTVERQDGLEVQASSVTLDNTGLVATFTPKFPLLSGFEYTVTIKGGINGVKDLAVPGNELVLDYSWSFTTGPATGVCLPPVAMGLSSTFGIAATYGIDNTGATTVNGDVVLNPNITCNDTSVDNAGGTGLCGGFAPVINGTVITPTYPDTTTAAAVTADLRSVFISLAPAQLPGGFPIAAPTTMGGITEVLNVSLFYPGAYISGVSMDISGTLVLDAQGNEDAVFVFQTGSTLTTLANTVIVLRGGAKASNVWWQVGSSATLGTGTVWQGNILAYADVTMTTGATSCGRIFAGASTDGAFTFDNNTVSVPGNVNAPVDCE